MPKKAAPAPAPVITTTVSSTPVGGHGDTIPTPLQETEVITWGNEGVESVQSSAPSAAEAAAPEVITWGAEAVVQDDAAKAAKIQALLSGKAPAPTEEAPATEAAPAAEAEATQAEETTEEAPVPVPVKANRRDLMAKIQEEKQRLGIEAQLKNERGERERLEKIVKTGSALQLLQARGMSREEALQELIENPEDAAEAVAPTVTKDPEIESIKSEFKRMKEKEIQQAIQHAQAYTQQVTANLDIPMVRAAKSIPVPTGNGQIRMVSGFNLVMETAHALSTQAGDADNAAMYLVEAAQLVEEQLVEDNRDLMEAYAAKTGRTVVTTPAAKPPAAAPKKPAASLGKRMGGGQNNQATAVDLPTDYTDRMAAVKARMGWK